MTLKRYLKATLDVYLIKKNFADEKKNYPYKLCQIKILLLNM